MAFISQQKKTYDGLEFTQVPSFSAANYFHWSRDVWKLTSSVLQSLSKWSPLGSCLKTYLNLEFPSLSVWICGWTGLQKMALYSFQLFLMHRPLWFVFLLCLPLSQQRMKTTKSNLSHLKESQCPVLGLLSRKKNMLCLSDNCEILFSLERAAFCILAKSWLSFLINAANMI